MAVTREQWDAREQELAQAKRDRRPINEGLLKQAAVHAALLTGQPSWDKYLQTLQVDVETAEVELTALHDKLGTPLNDELLRLTYVNVNMVRERLRVLKYCMGLPNDILNHAEDVLDKSTQ